MNTQTSELQNASRNTSANKKLMRFCLTWTVPLLIPPRHTSKLGNTCSLQGVRTWTKIFFVRHISGLSDSQVSEKFKLPVSSSEKDEHFIQNISHVTEIPGAAAFVRKCQQIGLVHIVTNSNKRAAMALLDRLGLSDLPLLAAQDVRIGKPNPEPYSKAMRTLGVSPTKCLVFEDSRGGMISGRAARAQYVIAVNNNLKNCDTFLSNFNDIDPAELIDSLVSVSHLSEELSELLGQKSTVYPIRASGGYISEILSASSGSRNLVIKQENNDHGVLQEVSEYLNLHDTECIFYRCFANISPIRTPKCYGLLPKSHAIVMEDLRQYDRAPEFALDSGLKVVRSIAKFHSHFRGAPLGGLSTHSAYMRTHVLDNYPKFEANLKQSGWVQYQKKPLNFSITQSNIMKMRKCIC